MLELFTFSLKIKRLSSVLEEALVRYHCIGLTWPVMNNNQTSYETISGLSIFQKLNPIQCCSQKIQVSQRKFGLK